MRKTFLEIPNLYPSFDPTKKKNMCKFLKIKIWFSQRLTSEWCGNLLDQIFEDVVMIWAQIKEGHELSDDTDILLISPCLVGNFAQVSDDVLAQKRQEFHLSRSDGSHFLHQRGHVTSLWFPPYPWGRESVRARLFTRV